MSTKNNGKDAAAEIPLFAQDQAEPEQGPDEKKVIEQSEALIKAKQSETRRELPAVMTKQGSEFLQKYVAKKASAQDLVEIQIQLLAKRRNFQDVIEKKVHVLPFWDNDTKSYRYAVVDNYLDVLARIQETGEYEGIEIKDDAEPGKPPTWCEVTIYKKNCTHPFVRRVYWDEFVQLTREGKPRSNWAGKGAYMLQKCGVMACARLAFPKQCLGISIEEEYQIEPADVIDDQPHSKQQYDGEAERVDVEDDTERTRLVKNVESAKTYFVGNGYEKQWEKIIVGVGEKTDTPVAAFSLDNLKKINEKSRVEYNKLSQPKQGEENA